VFRRRQELGFEMIDLYTAPTPNGWKATVALEELGLEYRLHPIDLSAGEQRHKDFLALNPNGRIPVIVDHEGGRSRVPVRKSKVVKSRADLK